MEWIVRLLHLLFFGVFCWARFIYYGRKHAGIRLEGQNPFATALAIRNDLPYTCGVSPLKEG